MRNNADVPALAEEEILAWADAYNVRTGQWPTFDSGPTPGARRNLVEGRQGPEDGHGRTGGPIVAPATAG